MRLFFGFLDRVVFTLGVLVFMQLPHFVDQYTHRLGGYTRAAQEQLAQYQAIAQASFNGDLEALIREFENSPTPAIAQTGRQVAQTRSRAIQLQEGLRVLEARALARKLIYLAAYLEPQIARDSLRSFTPGLPLTSAALVCGLLGGISSSLLLQGLLRIPRWLGRGVWKLGRRAG
ncbi:MAG: DUF2937 family protein [Desulfobacterales bacterium]